MDERNLINMKTNIIELKEAEELYNNCFIITKEELERLSYPSLRYTLYSFNIKEAFRERVEQIIKVIEKIKEKLINYESKELDSNKEQKKLDEYIEKLNLFKKESEGIYLFNKEYLINIAKKADTIKNDIAKNIHVKSSEEILKAQIEYNIKAEKSLILIKDDINNLKNIFNIKDL